MVITNVTHGRFTHTRWRAEQPPDAGGSRRDGGLANSVGASGGLDSST